MTGGFKNNSQVSKTLTFNGTMILASLDFSNMLVLDSVLTQIGGAGGMDLIKSKTTACSLPDTVTQSHVCTLW